MTSTNDAIESLRRFLTVQLDKQKDDAEQAEDVANKQLDAIKELLDEQLDTKLKGVHEGLREGYHKECVKVYRNVQAAFAEENQRQTAQMEETLKKLSGKHTMTTVFAVLAFLAAIGGLTLQILGMLGIL